ncbi:iron-siderophore ABC transporter substrate-binding protein [Paenibacillus sp. GD4]|uniref:ABC transporter substrate-binding protein n=1 Tax=Paenibacillus sp. GD4 TaxID=3068890 RepID=UPI002796E006|nr:iron-siderophore ABC transporter substrate-binding protein [Paenibacillus sp. GD4]MDQ1914908.1 iron-siderophore ABC transporter substrate-binding protein [Paenibacillus sp. GD4]
MLRFHFKPIALLIAIVLLIAGCGNSAAPANSASKPADSAATQKESQASKRTIKHVLGTTDLEAAPKKIVALEWVYAEDLLALGIQPAGVADIAGYKKSVNVKPALEASVVDVGTRQEPNLETIAAIKPDLIIGVSFRHKAIYDKLKGIAPTIMFEPYPPENGPNQYQEMEETFLTIADAVDKKTAAQDVLKKLNDSYAQAGEKLKKAGKNGTEFVLVQGFSSKDVPTIRAFTENSMASQIMGKIGLKNAYKSSKFEAYGFATTNVEALPAVQKANFFYVVTEEDNIFTKQLKDNPVWKGLDFVKENRTYSLGGATWLFGGPISAQVFVDQVTTLLAK